MPATTCWAALHTISRAPCSMSSFLRASSTAALRKSAVNDCTGVNPPAMRAVWPYPAGVSVSLSFAKCTVKRGWNDSSRILLSADSSETTTCANCVVPMFPCSSMSSSYPPPSRVRVVAESIRGVVYCSSELLCSDHVFLANSAAAVTRASCKESVSSLASPDPVCKDPSSHFLPKRDMLSPSPSPSARISIARRITTSDCQPILQFFLVSVLFFNNSCISY
mmetsp:Transcript_23587/g.39564  ORF Transcript_23587/g.39564 Transcript_23587/m.39564 type:complete len:222 (+) Transcript_23587:310-975(+)